jgi:hypothetical protein
LRDVVGRVLAATPSPTAAKPRHSAAQVEVSAWHTARWCRLGSSFGNCLSCGTVDVLVTRERFDAPLLAPVNRAVRQSTDVTFLGVAKIALRDRSAVNRPTARSRRSYADADEVHCH